MSTVTAEEILEILETDLTDLALEGVIAREEAYLASRVGQLEGERTQILWPIGHGPLRLRRPTDLVDVLGPDDSTIDVRLVAAGWAIERPTDTRWPSPLRATYTPTDIEIVRGCVVELVGIALTFGGAIVSDREGAHSVQRFQAAGAYGELREDVVRRLRPPASLSTTTLRSTLQTRMTPANGELDPVVSS